MRSTNGESDPTCDQSSSKLGSNLSTYAYRYLIVNFCNIRSLFPKLYFIETYLKTNNIDLFFCTESWLTPFISDGMVTIDNYNVLRSDRSHSPGGGVVAYYKNNLNIKLNVINYSTFDSVLSNFEFLCIDLYDNGLRTRFLCIYLPPKFSICTSTIKTVCKLIDNFSSALFPCFVIGDFNLPKINWELYSTNGGMSHKTFLQFCVNNGWTQQIQTSTHVKNNILDLLLSNFLGNKLLHSFSVNPPLTSKCDHNLISMKLLIENKNDNSLPSPPLLNFKKANFQRISEELLSVIWNLPPRHINSFLPANLQTFYNYFLNILHEVIAKNTPLQRPKSRKFQPPKYIKKILKQKRAIYKRYKTDKTLKSKYKMKSMEYENAVKKWRDGVEENLCKDPTSRKFYGYINKKFKCKSTIPPLLSHDQQLCFSDKEKANIFNHNFQKVFVVDDGKLPASHQLSSFLMDDIEITSYDIKIAISKMKSKLTRSPEGIPSFVLKQISQSILLPLRFIFNSCLREHWVPQQWKNSLIVPIFKKGDKSNPLNYRPISLTSTFSRLFESIIHAKISNHLNKFKLISPFQYGFLKKRSSCEQLLTCIYEWLSTVYKGNSCVHVIYTDIAKAFDTVSHKKLVSTLKSYGLNLHVISWIEEFLNNRVQSVCIGASISDPLPVYSGVPQGSVLGPLLFLMYIDGITSCVSSSNAPTGIRLFADDAKLFSTGEANLQLSLNNLVSWLDDHQLKIAANKCNSICLHKTKAVVTPPIFSIKTQNLLYNPLIRDLGVMISDDLKWDPHINQIVKKSSLKSYQLLKFFKSRNVWTLKKLFCTYVRPLLEYNTPVWSPYLLKNKASVESIQKRYTKVIFRRCGISYTSYQDRLYKLDLESLERRRINYDLILLYKIIHGLSCIKFQDYFKFTVTPYSLRRNSVQIIPNHQTKPTNQLWQNNFFHRVYPIWNELPDEIATATNLNDFKIKLKKHKIVNRLSFV